MNAAATQQRRPRASKNQRKLVGRVVSNKMQKTVVVQVERRVRTPMMGKIITRSSKYHAHVAERRLRRGRPGRDRRVPADLENQVLDRHAACREVESRLKLDSFPPVAGSKTAGHVDRQVGEKEKP